MVTVQVTGYLLVHIRYTNPKCWMTSTDHGTIIIEERIQWPTRTSRSSVSNAVIVLLLPPGSRSFLLPKATRTSLSVVSTAVRRDGLLVVQKVQPGMHLPVRCIPRCVPSVGRNARCHSSPGRGNQSIAVSVTARTKSADSGCSNRVSL